MYTTAYRFFWGGIPPHQSGGRQDQREIVHSARELVSFDPLSSLRITDNIWFPGKSRCWIISSLAFSWLTTQYCNRGEDRYKTGCPDRDAVSNIAVGWVEVTLVRANHFTVETFDVAPTLNQHCFNIQFSPIPVAMMPGIANRQSTVNLANGSRLGSSFFLMPGWWPAITGGTRNVPDRGDPPKLLSMKTRGPSTLLRRSGLSLATLMALLLFRQTQRVLTSDLLSSANKLILDNNLPLMRKKKIILRHRYRFTRLNV